MVKYKVDSLEINLKNGKEITIDSSIPNLDSEEDVRKYLKGNEDLLVSRKGEPHRTDVFPRNSISYISIFYKEK